MSHFSKIKTNISSLSILKQTIQQLGFHYELAYPSEIIKSKEFTNASMYQNLLVYSSSVNVVNKKPLFSFVWNNSEYHLLVDLQLWSLNMDVNYFIDKLSQKYAYNMILSQSMSSGFQKINEKCISDGSIQVVVQKWFS